MHAMKYNGKKKNHKLEFMISVNCCMFLAPEDGTSVPKHVAADTDHEL